MGTLFLSTLKQNYKLLLIFIFILNMYQGVIISMANPIDMSEIAGVFEFAEPMLAAFGINIAEFSTVLNYTASVFFSVLVMAFTMVFYVIQSIGLIAKPVADTSIANTLMLPVTRFKLAFVKGLYLAFSLLVLYLFVFVGGSFFLSRHGEFDIGAYFNLVFVNCALATMVASVSYFLSVVFCDSKWGVNLAVSVPIALILLSIIGGASEDLEFIKNLSPFAHIDAVGVVTNEINTLPYYLLFYGLSTVLIVFAGLIFKRKNLNI